MRCNALQRPRCSTAVAQSWTSLFRSQCLFRCQGPTDCWRVFSVECFPFEIAILIRSWFTRDTSWTFCRLGLHISRSVHSLIRWLIVWPGQRSWRGITVPCHRRWTKALLKPRIACSPKPRVKCIPKVFHIALAVLWRWKDNNRSNSLGLPLVVMQSKQGNFVICHILLCVNRSRNPESGILSTETVTWGQACTIVYWGRNHGPMKIISRQRDNGITLFAWLFRQVSSLPNQKWISPVKSFLHAEFLIR